jgi:hypothetical protein
MLKQKYSVIVVIMWEMNLPCTPGSCRHRGSWAISFNRKVLLCPQCKLECTRRLIFTSALESHSFAKSESAHLDVSGHFPSAAVERCDCCSNRFTAMTPGPMSSA